MRESGEPGDATVAASVDVSIIVPAYNVDAFLQVALDRLREQEYPAFEIVVVDDASTDGTAEVARAASASDDRIVLVRQDANAGVAAARERGLAAARGEFVWFVDADDDWDAGALRRMVGTARATGADLVCAAAEYVSEDGSRRAVGSAGPPRTMSGGEAFGLLLNGAITGHLWNKLFRRSPLERISFTRARQHSDQAMVAQLLADARTVAVIDDVVYRYHLRSGSIIRSGSRRAESLKTVRVVVTECAARLDPDLPSSSAFGYYTARFNLLSRLKDATSGAYSSTEEDAIVQQVRKEITPGLLAATLQRRDLRRFVMLAAAKTNAGLYRRLMRRPGTRD
ncbi:glycosyltransferase family 2 protein [Agromyces binzhouensis]|uniref:glycosyltransferase family 2 protein n=1 Tax=Agromyces binzhouensis TaxID=1817495 RepID=UPI003639DCA5